MKLSKDRGRIKVTIETDVVVMKEMYGAIVDLLMAVEKRLPLWKKAFDAFVEFMENLDK